MAVTQIFCAAPGRTLVLEADLSRVEPGELSHLMLELGRLPEGQSLRSHLSDGTWELLVEHCESDRRQLQESQEEEEEEGW